METALGSRGTSAVAAVMDETQPAVYEYFRGRLDATAAQAMTLKVMNLWLGRHHMRARSTRLGSRPYVMYIDPSNSCNLGCPGCVHSSTSKEKHLFDWRPGILSQSRLEMLLEAYGPYAAHIGFYNYGDPMVNALTPKLIRLAKTYLIQTAASSNLSFPKLDAEALVDSGLDYLTMSIDGATQEVYGRYRRKGKLDVVLNNIARLAEAKRKRNKQTPILSWQFLAFEHNAHEIEAAKQIAKDLGADQFSVVSPYDVSWDDPTIHPANIAPSRDEFNPLIAEGMYGNFNPFPAELAAAAIAREFAVAWAHRFQESRANLGAPEARHTCQWLYRAMVMDAGGRVLPCCCSPTPQRDLVFSEQPEHERALDHYNSAKYDQVRTYFADPEAYRRTSNGHDPHCVNCTWNQEETNFGNPHLQNYLRGVEFHTSGGNYESYGTIFDPGCVELLCTW